MHNINAILSDSSLFMDIIKFPGDAKRAYQAKEEGEKKNGLDAPFLEFVLSPGGCVI
jgi:hypothetical protein